MGAHAYCRKCGGPLDMPTIRDAILGAQTCAGYLCDEKHPLDDMDKAWVLEAFMEDQAALVRRVDELERRASRQADHRR